MPLSRWIGVGLAVCICGGAATWIVSRRTPGLQPDGSWLVETGQTLTPVGTLIQTPFARPKDVAASPDGQSVAVLATDGVHVFDLQGKETSKIAFGTGALGIAWGPKGSRIFASQSNGSVALLQRDGAGWKRTELKIDLAGKTGNPQANGIAVSSDGTKIYVALGVRNVLVEADAQTGAVLRSAPIDSAPYHVVMGRTGVYVACRAGALPLTYSPYAENSAGTPVRTDPLTDSVRRGTVQRVDLASFSVTKSTDGRGPGMMVRTSDSLFTAMADSDFVAVTKGGRTERALMRPPDDANFGQIPTGLALSKDGKTLYVSLGGANAIAVCEVSDSIRVKGYVPTAWYPIDIELIGDTLVVACSKGIGSRAESKNAADATNRGLKFQEGLYYIHNNVGAVQFIDTRKLTNLDQLTRRVALNNSWGKELTARKNVAPVPIPERVGEPSTFKHVVYIIKENLSYDSVLGDMKEGNGRADLCMFPEKVSPNHHKISRDFVLLDNTYVSGTNSADGHQWTSSGIANDYMERSYNAYTRSYPYDGGDPLAYSPEGFLWNAAIKSGLKVRVYGEFVDQPSVRHKETGKSGTFKEVWADYKSGANKYEIKAKTSLHALEPVLHPNYIGFPNNVSDQWRADQFLADLAAWEKSGSMPSLCVLLLPNDHTVGLTPDYPTPQAAVADNDLAMGRIVEAISNSRFWKDTLVLGIQDDCQLGIDHVDGHRTFGFVASPYTRRGAVVSEFYTTTSFVRTIGLVLGMPAMTRFDRSAVPLRACFVSQPNLRPYTKAMNQIPLDQFTPPANKLTGRLRELALKSMALDWSDVDRADADVVAQAAWYNAFPNRPFPWEHFNPNPDLDDDDENMRVFEGQSRARDDD